ncbi:tyrosine-type recombinase/integrase [Halobacteriovorax sp. ZH2_bin.1]|uniref:tyrosine-type recombinase/integrase n=1 Tax=unclassified Halobacteriovorax TaxID=2639665 RepID=UPI0037174DBF
MKHNLYLIKKNELSEIEELEYEFFSNFNSENTKTSYRIDLNTFFDFMRENFAGMTTVDVTRFAIVAYKKWMQDTCYAPKTIHRKLASLSSFFTFLMEKGIINQNPCYGVRRPRQEVIKETQDLTDEEVERLLITIENNASLMHKAILYLLFTTGLRRGEVINTRLKNYIEENGQMTVTVTGKGGKSLKKYLHDSCASAINEYLEEMAEKGRAIHPEDWIFQPSHNPRSKNKDLCRPLCPKSIRYIIKKYCKMAGINKEISPHSARATYIGSALENGAHLVKVSKDVGHSSTKTTEMYNKRRVRADDSPVKNLGYLKKAS